MKSSSTITSSSGLNAQTNIDKITRKKTTWLGEIYLYFKNSSPIVMYLCTFLSCKAEPFFTKKIHIFKFLHKCKNNKKIYASVANQKITMSLYEFSNFWFFNFFSSHSYIQIKKCIWRKNIWPFFFLLGHQKQKIEKKYLC